MFISPVSAFVNGKNALFKISSWSIASSTSIGLGGKYTFTTFTAASFSTVFVSGSYFTFLIIGSLDWTAVLILSLCFFNWPSNTSETPSIAAYKSTSVQEAFTVLPPR